MIMNATSFEYRAELLAWLICSSGTHGPRRQTPKHDYMAHAVRHRNMITWPMPSDTETWLHAPAHAPL